MSTDKAPLSTYIWLGACLVAASIEPIVVKLGYAANCSPWQLLALKSLVGALVILPLSRKLEWVGLPGLKQILPLAFLLLSTGSLMLFSLQYIKASLLITIMTVTPAAVAVINQFLGRDILGPKFWFGFALAACGLRLSLPDELGALHFAGVASAFLAVASSCTYRVLLERKTKLYKPALISSYIFIINGIALLPLFFMPGLSFASASPFLLASGVWLGLAAALANLAFLYAISILGSTRVSIITMLQRPIVIALSAIVLEESLSICQILGISMVIIGVQMAEVKRKTIQQNTVSAEITTEAEKQKVPV